MGPDAARTHSTLHTFGRSAAPALVVSGVHFQSPKRAGGGPWAKRPDGVRATRRLRATREAADSSALRRPSD